MHVFPRVRDIPTLFHVLTGLYGRDALGDMCCWPSPFRKPTELGLAFIAGGVDLRAHGPPRQGPQSPHGSAASRQAPRPGLHGGDIDGLAL